VADLPDASSDVRVVNVHGMVLPFAEVHQSAYVMPADGRTIGVGPSRMRLCLEREFRPYLDLVALPVIFVH